MRFSRRFVLPLALGPVFTLPTPLLAQGYVLRVFDGTVPGENLGRSVSAGEFDGDGTADLLVGAPGFSPGGLAGAGRAYAFSGASGAALLLVDGGGSYEGLGSSVAAVADLDFDGLDEILAGSHGFLSLGGTLGTGRAQVFSGAGGAVLFAFVGAGYNDYFGSSVAAPGDVDGDGTPDLFVGAPESPYVPVPGSGYATVFSGASGAFLQGWAGRSLGDYLGSSVAGAGDLDLDGLADLLVGAPGADPGGLMSAGRASVRRGSTGATLQSIDGAAAGDLLGSKVASAGDVDGDGIPDLLVASQNADPGGLSQAGLVQVFSGATGALLYGLAGPAPYAGFGASLAGAGDLTGDAKADFLVGVPFASPNGLANAGLVRAFSGSDGTVLLTLDGSNPGDAFGIALASAGDVNADGLPDWIVGASAADPSGLSEAGRATVFSFAGIPPGSAVSGTGCPGPTGTVALIQTAGGFPSVGNAAFSLVLSGAAGATNALLLAGLQPLSVGLGSLGLPACTLLVYPDFLIPRTTTSEGVAFLPLPIPPLSSLVGGWIRFQGYVANPGPAPLPGSMTARLDLQVVP